jgi:hypothetical protein
MLTLQDQGPIYFIFDAIDECPNSTGTPSPRENVLELIRVAIGIAPFTTLYLRHQQTRGRYRSCSPSLGILYGFPSWRGWTKGRYRQLHQVVHKLRPEDAEMEEGG